VSASKVDKAAFAEKVAGLVKDFTGLVVKKDQVRGELVRVFGDAWVDRLEEAIQTDRLVCERCKVDFEEWNEMADDRTCYDCASAIRSEQFRKSIGLSIE
jgi:hypothetical protein